MTEEELIIESMKEKLATAKSITDQEKIDHWNQTNIIDLEKEIERRESL